MKPANFSIRDEKSSQNLTSASLDANVECQWQITRFVASFVERLKVNFRTAPSSSSSPTRILLLLNLAMASAVAGVTTNDNENSLTLTNRMGKVDLIYKIPGRFSSEVSEIFRRTPTGHLDTVAEKSLMQNAMASIARQLNYNIENNDGFGRTHFMVLFGDVETLKQELIAGADPTAITTSGFSLLHIAVEVVNPSIFAMLLEYGADPDRALKTYRSVRQRLETDCDCSEERKILKQYDEKRKNKKQHSQLNLPIAKPSPVDDQSFFGFFVYLIFSIFTSCYFASLKIKFFTHLIFSDRDERSTETVAKQTVPQKRKTKQLPQRISRVKSQVLLVKPVITSSHYTRQFEVVKQEFVDVMGIPENKAKLLIYDYEKKILLESKNLFPFNRKMISARTQIIAKMLMQNGFSVSLAGGAFLYAALMADRNIKDKQSLPIPQDFDLETNAGLEDLIRLFPDQGQVVGNQYPLFEVYDTNGSIQIVNVTDPKQKARERDFTVNALKYDFASDSVVDYGGVKHLYSEDYFNRLIRTTSGTEIKLRQDASRVLRGITLSVKTGFSFDEKIKKIITQQKSLNVRSDLFYKRLIRLFLTGQARASLDILLENNWWNKIFVSYNDINQINLVDAITFLQNLCDKLDETYLHEQAHGKLSTAQQRLEFQQSWTPLLIAGIFYYPLRATGHLNRTDIKNYIETEISQVVMLPQKIKSEWLTQTKSQLVNTYFALLNPNCSVTSECLIIQEILTRIASEQAQVALPFNNR